MQAGVREGAGRWDGSGGLKVSTKDREEDGAASRVEDIVAEERVATAAVAALALAPVDASLAVLPVPVPVLVPVLLSLLFFFLLEISTTLNLHMT